MFKILKNWFSPTPVESPRRVLSDGEKVLMENFPSLFTFTCKCLEDDCMKARIHDAVLGKDGSDITEPYLTIAEDILDGNWEATSLDRSNKIELRSEKLGLYVRVYAYDGRYHDLGEERHNLVHPTFPELRLIEFIARQILKDIVKDRKRVRDDKIAEEREDFRISVIEKIQEGASDD